jgi:hypothetical protein
MDCDPGCAQPSLARRLRLDIGRGSARRLAVDATGVPGMADIDAKKRRLIELVRERSFSTGG